MKKDFLAVFNRFSKANNRKLDFLLSTVPHLDKVNSKLILEDYMYSVQIAESAKGTILTEQGKTEKEVEFPNLDTEKNILAKRTTTVQVAKLGPSTMIGEELLFGQNKEKRYRYTAKVDSTEALIYYMKANELQLKFPKDALQGLRLNFQKKENYHQLRVKALVEKHTENPGFYSEYTSYTVKHVFEKMRPSSSTQSLVKAVKREEIGRATQKMDKQENERLVKSRSQLWQSVSSREVMSIHSEIHTKHNPALENYYEDLREAQERQRTLNLTASPKTGHDHNDNEAVSSDNNNEESDTDNGQEQNNVFELTSLAHLRQEHDNAQSATQTAIKRGSMLTTASIDNTAQQKMDSLIKVMTFSRPQSQQIPEAKSRRRMGVGSAEQLKSTIVKPKLQIDTKQKSIVFDFGDKKSPRNLNPPKTADNAKRRTIKFDSLPLEVAQSFQALNETSQLRNEGSVEMLPDVDYVTPAADKAKVRSVSAKVDRDNLRSVQRLKTANGNVIELPNKRHYIIRQREHVFPDQEALKQHEASHDAVKIEKAKAFGEDGLSKFNFGDFNSDEAAYNAKKKVLLRRMLERRRIVANDRKAPDHSRLNSNQSGSLLTILKAVISPKKDELYQKIASSYTQTPKGRPLTASTESLLINAKELDSPVNINSYQSTNYHGLTSHTRTNTLNDSKSSISGSVWNLQSRGKFVFENSTTPNSRGLKELSSPMIRKDTATSRVMQTAVTNLEKKFFLSERKLNSKPKVGAALSLQLKKKMYNSLKFSKKSAPWKEPFKREESAKSFLRPSGPVILEVKSMAYEQDQELITFSSRLGD